MANGWTRERVDSSSSYHLFVVANSQRQSTRLRSSVVQLWSITHTLRWSKGSSGLSLSLNLRRPRRAMKVKGDKQWACIKGFLYHLFATTKQLDGIKSVDWTHGSAVDSVPVSSDIFFSRVLNIALCLSVFCLCIWMRISLSLLCVNNPLQHLCLRSTW